MNKKLKLFDDNSQIEQELEELKRYTALVEKRLKETTNAEAAANVKILNLLDDVQKLTKENQELLESKWNFVEPESGRSFGTK
jgi:cell division septum initiation protein DivIVA